MMHQIVDLDGYSSLEIGLRIAAKYRARWRYIAAVAVGKAAGNAMVPSKALNVKESTRAAVIAKQPAWRLMVPWKTLFAIQQASNRQTSGEAFLCLECKGGRRARRPFA